jgi:hypothetical protein
MHENRLMQSFHRTKNSNKIQADAESGHFASALTYRAAKGGAASMDKFYPAARRKQKLSPAVHAVGQINLVGNIIPHSWYQHPDLKSESGTPNLVAIILLSDLVYWHRPVVERDEVSNQITSVRNKFSGDRLHRKYDSWGKHFGLTKRQVQDAVTFLHNRGLIVRDQEKRVELANGAVLGNVIYLTPVPARIAALCSFVPDSIDSDDEIPITFESDRGSDSPTGGTGIPFYSDRGHDEAGEGVPSDSDSSPAKTGDITKSSLEISKQIYRETTTDHHAPASEPVPDPTVVVSNKRVGAGESLILRLETVGIDADEAACLIRDFGSTIVDEVVSSAVNRKNTQAASNPARYISAICRKKEEAEAMKVAEATARSQVVRAPRPAPTPKTPVQDPIPSTLPVQVAKSESFDPAAAYVALSEAERITLDEESWARAMADAPAPIRARLEAASKSQEPLSRMVRDLLLISRNAILIGRKEEIAGAKKRQIDLDFN